MAEDRDPFLVFNGESNDDDVDHGVGMDDKENLSDDVPLTIRLSESAFSGATFERKAAARQIQDAFAQAYFMEEPLANIISIIERLVEDDEQVVRAEITDQLWKLALFCDEIGPPLDYLLPKHILPYSVRLLTDEYAQVRKLAQTGVLNLLEKEIITLSQLQEYIYPVILQLTQHPATDDHRTEAASFMSKLALLIGKEATVKFYLERFCLLCKDTTFAIRRVCAASMGDFAKVIGTALTQEVLLPKFLSLCGDDAWSVRKGCAEVFTSVSSMCELSVRKETLSTAFINLLEDPSRWVRVSAYESLGSLIATYSGGEDNCSKQELSPLEEDFIQRLKTNGEQEHLEDKFQKMVQDCMSRPDTETVIDIPDVNGNSAGQVVSNDGSGDSPKLTGETISPSNSPNDEYFRDVEKSFYEDDLSFEEMNCDMDVKELPVVTELFKKCESTTCASDKSNESKPVSNINIPLRDVENNVPLSKSDASCNFNTWQYWRLPVTNFDDIDLEFELCSAKANFPASSSSPLTSLSDVDAVNANFQKSVQEEGGGDGSPTADAPASEEDFFEKRTRERKGSGGFNTKRKVKSEPVEQSDVDIWGDFAEPGKALETLELVSSNTSPFTEESSPDAQEKFESICSNYEWKEDKSPEISFEEASSHVSGDVHRSYMNLFKPYTEEGSYYNEVGSIFEPDDLPYILRAHGPKGNSKLLPNIPEPSTPILQSIVPDELLKHFVEMCSPTRDHTLESELANVCVYSFPAIVYTLGPENWQLVRNCFESLALRYQWKIRYTLAASLHEIAAVLGPDLSSRDLMPFYKAMTKDLDEVRIGVLKNLANFVNVLPEQDKKEILESLKTFLSVDNKRNWRFKVELSDQVALLAELYEVEDIANHLCGVAFELILDSISAVRQAGVDLICFLLNKIKGSPSSEAHIRDLIGKLVTLLCCSKRWTHRQLFAKLSRQLLVTNAIGTSEFADHVLPHLIALGDDPIPNVRLVVAQTLTSEVEELFDPADPHYEVVLGAISMLKCDPDRDVQHFSGGKSMDREATLENLNETS